MGKIKDKAIEEENRQADNMGIWDKVSRTDPDSTKEVSFGRKFTAIDAHSQIKAATEMFGPVGLGWGYNCQYGFQTMGDHHVMIFCDLQMWWREKHQWEGMSTPGKINAFGPIRGMCLLTAKAKDKLPDHDASKKAMTDALTKALSHLGFNADVFLGQFDDNKYVQELKKDKAAAVETQATEYASRRTAFIAEIQEAKTGDEIDAIMKVQTWFKDVAPGTLAELKSWVNKQKLEFVTDDSANTTDGDNHDGSDNQS